MSSIQMKSKLKLETDSLKVQTQQVGVGSHKGNYFVNKTINKHLNMALNLFTTTL